MLFSRSSIDHPTHRSTPTGYSRMDKSHTSKVVAYCLWKYILLIQCEFESGEASFRTINVCLIEIRSMSGHSARKCNFYLRASTCRITHLKSTPYARNSERFTFIMSTQSGLDVPNCMGSRWFSNYSACIETSCLCWLRVVRFWFEQPNVQENAVSKNDVSSTTMLWKVAHIFLCLFWIH